MKLLTKTSIFFVVTSGLVFCLGGLWSYYFLHNLITEEVEENLAYERALFLQQIEKYDSFKQIVLPADSSIIIGQVVGHATDSKLTFSDTLIYNTFNLELLPYRQLKFTAKINNTTREVTIHQSLIESDDLIMGIVYSIIIMFAVIIVIISVLNIFGLRFLWLPFNKILEQIKVFDFRSNRGFEPVKTDIFEFAELNNELSNMTQKLTHDYNSLKEFSENASHEMQTPLAIIQSKLELLFQQTDFNEETLRALKSTYQAANRLSRLHYELNLLSRIENREFKELSTVSLKVLIEGQIENFSDILELKKLTLETSFQSDPVVKGNTFLLEILISNLFSNAIKHNQVEGKIIFELTSNLFTISNSGPPPNFPPETLFERFRKGIPTSDSTGLGLSIVKQICLIHNFEISYSFNGQSHIIIVTF
jgi:signal transduction histidine kinase